MHYKQAFTAIVEGVIAGKSRHVLLNNIVSNYFIDFNEAEEFYGLVIKLVKTVRSDTERNS